MTVFSPTDGLVHVLLVAFSVVVLFISLLAYANRRNYRYLFLSLAFTFLAPETKFGNSCMDCVISY